MMKRNLIIALLVSFCFSACNEDDMAESLNTGEVQFITDLPGSQSKVTTGSHWEGNEHLGIFMLDNGSTNISTIGGTSMDNLEYTVDMAGGNSSTITAATTSIVMGSGQYDFVAYYPYGAGNTIALNPASTLSFDMSGQTSNQVALDLLYASENDGGSGYGPTTTYVNLNFRHQFSKVVFKISLGTGIDQIAAMSMKVDIADLIQQCDFNLLSGSMTLTGSAASQNIPRYNGANVQYEAIVLPQTVSSNTVTFDVYGDNTTEPTYDLPTNDATSPLTSFVAGNQYTFNISISASSLELIGVIIEPWDDSDFDIVAD